jgi:hypothetical protein
MANNLIVRPLGPLVSAINSARRALYTAPRTTIGTLSDNDWPSAMQPVQPMGPPKAEPLRFPFNWGQNLNFTPRYDATYSAAQLRQRAKYPLARICIQNNKDIISRLPRQVRLKSLPGESARERKARSKNDTTLKMLNDFFDRPNEEHDWSEFIRPVLDDLFVIDAPAVFLCRSTAKSNTGKIVGLRWLEGASITRLVEEHGWTPPPPYPAYQQLWEGYPRVDLTTDQLVYRPANICPRDNVSSYLYGYSPTEMVAEEIDIGWARLNFVKAFYEKGEIPQAMHFVPKGTPPDKIKEAQQWIDEYLAGQLGRRRGLQIFQGFQEDGKSEQVFFPKEPELADIFDDMHIRKICFAYGTSPQRLMRMMNRASAIANQESAEEEGTLPWLDWLERFCNYILQVKMGYTQYEMSFDALQELDALKRAQADKIDISIGLKTRNQVLEDRGEEPSDEPAADELSVITSSGVIPLDKAGELAQMAIRAKASGGVGGGSANLRTTAQGNKIYSVPRNGSTGHCSNHSSHFKGCIDCEAVEVLVKLEAQEI